MTANPDPPSKLIRNSTAEFLIFTAQDGNSSIEARYEDETIWLTQRLMAELFDVDVRTISEHLGNIFSSGELEREATIRKFRIVRREGSRDVTRNVEHYNLDAIISVGYRVNSITITQFRIWAAKLLRERLVQKCSVNQDRLESEVGLGEVLTYYLPSLRLLRDYDDGVITQQSEGRSPLWELGHEDAQAIIARLREEFPDDTLLGVENDDGLQSVVATIYQSFAGQDLYPTLEEKAANLLYLVVKDHPLADGNKRSAAALFVEFLDRNAALYQADGVARVSNNALAAMTLMVAMSSPQEKDLMVALIQRMIGAA